MSLFETYGTQLVGALGITALASVLSFALAIVVGTLIALARRSRWAILRVPATIYVEALRNTPALLQIFIVFFGFPAIGIIISPLTAGVIALGLNGAAYVGEILRAGLANVSPGQLEAAKTLGISRGSTLGYVVLPQAFRYVYPPLVNELLQIILGTSLLSAIGVNDLTGQSLVINSITFRTMEVFTIALVGYLIITGLVTLATRLLAKVIFKPPLPRARLRPRLLRTTGGTS